ncbi:MAG: RNA 2',3'-cyclic phosphodiesterase [Streptosporangiales bacterium]
MRLFAALAPPDEVLAEVVERVAPIRARQPELRWAPAERMHLTLAFYGEVDEDPTHRLRGRLARVAGRYGPLTLHFGGAGAFPRRTRARVLWVGVDGDREQLCRLADSANAAGRRVGIGSEDRRYRPHVTIARAQVPRDVTGPVEELDTFVSISWTATELVLVHSIPGAQPAYETLAAFPLSRGE